MQKAGAGLLTPAQINCIAGKFGDSVTYKDLANSATETSLETQAESYGLACHSAG